MFGHCQCTDPSVQVHNHTSESFPIQPDQPCDARPASLSSTQEPLLLSSLLPGTSLFNRQTTQALLATPKLPQPLFHLIRIAAKPAIHCCSVTAVHWEARPLTTCACYTGEDW